MIRFIKYIIRVFGQGKRNLDPRVDGELTKEQPSRDYNMHTFKIHLEKDI